MGSGRDEIAGAAPSIDAVVERRPVRNEVAEGLTRRGFVCRASVLGLGALVAAAVPSAVRLAAPATAAAGEAGHIDATLQAFFDTMIPGRAATLTELGHPIHPGAIAGADADPGAVETDALLLSAHPKVGFTALAAPLVADLDGRSTAIAGRPFLQLDYAGRERVCISGLDHANPDRALWEAGAAVAFTAFCAAATHVRPTWANASGFWVMRFPGTAPNGYGSASYRRRLSRERTRNGSLP